MQRDAILDLLKHDDVVFFDDCLFSQYVFLADPKVQEDLEAKKIDVVLGFSSGLYADENAKQLYDVESHVLHDACNQRISSIDDADYLRTSLIEMNGFMKVSQLKELLQLPFCHLALHGCCHLKLQNQTGNKIGSDLLKNLQTFKLDVDSGIERLHALDLDSRTFVYPYIFSFPTSDAYLQKVGFTCIVGSYTSQMFRIAIEDLAVGASNCDS